MAPATRPIQYAVKRILDYALAAVGLVVVAPVAAVIAVAIRLDSRGPVLFRQERIGMGMQRFMINKFRTMAHGAPVVYNPDGSTSAEPGDDRITRVGSVLRGGLDELPQLINVLRGEMSIVGPRPDLPEHEELYTPFERRKASVRPGITNLGAILGRTEIPWKTRIALDLYYIDHWSLGLDFKIAVATLCMPLGLRPFEFADVRRHVALE
jgi:lipopolysaccharide/colanic/teichoic acid biosynthesis glycosyltransferase